MTNSFKQFYYDGTKAVNCDKNTLVNGNIFAGLAVRKLGMQGLPGLKFYLNGSSTPALLGNNNIFEIDAMDSMPIISIKFEEDNLTALIDNQPAAALIIDIIYAKED